MSLAHPAIRNGQMQEADVAELIRHAKEGDKAAQDQLFQLYRQRLKLWATAAFADQPRPAWDLSDALQESLAEASRDFPSFRGQHERELFAWLKSILKHTVVDRARHQRRQKRQNGNQQSLEVRSPSGTQLKDRIPNQDTSISRRVIRAEQIEQLQHMIIRLPEDQAMAVTLRHLQGLSIDEISNRMDRTAPSIAGLLIRAMRRLRELMDNEVP